MTYETKRFPLAPAVYATEREIRWEARRLFLRAVETAAPEVLKSLAELRPSEDALAAWARRWNLTFEGSPAGWALEAARRTIETWRRYPGLREREPLAWAPLAVGGWKLLPPEAARLWDPRELTERRLTRGQAAERARRHGLAPAATRRELDRIERLLEDRGLRPAPEKSLGLHFEWAVRWQCLGRSAFEIARDGYPSGVTRRVREVLNLIGLDPRPARRGRRRK